MSVEMQELHVPLWVVLSSGAATVVLATSLAYVLLEFHRNASHVSEAASEPKPRGSTGILVSKDDYPGGQLFVYYATQTGTAESFARQIEREGPEHGFFVHVVDLEDVSVEDLIGEENRFEDSGTARAVFLAATYGEGEAPDNSTGFVQSLKEKAGTNVSSAESLTEPETCLVGLDYCVFGLGNQQYDDFNAMGKLFDYCLERIGGNRIVELGLGDDDNDLEGDFEAWKDNLLWPTLKKMFVRSDQTKAQSSTQAFPESRYNVNFLDGRSSCQTLNLEEVHGQSKHYFTAFDCPVKVVRELRSVDDQGSTVHIEIDISGHSNFVYHTADNLGVIPENESHVVESVASILGYDLDQLFSVKAALGHDWHGAPFPMPITIRDFLTRYCDLKGPLRRSDLKQLAAYATKLVDQSALLRMSSKEGKSEYKEKILNEFIGLADLLQLCPSLSIPFDHFLSLCSLLQTRFFTIASSSSVYPMTIHLTVALTKAERRNGQEFKGLCSNFLKCSRPGETLLRVYTRPSSFRLPQDCSQPIVMIGPGTGIAPMRALLQERSYQRKCLNLNVGPNILYFGCKNPSQDFLYEHELKVFQADGDLAQLHVAFSRLQKKKCYVQHLLLENARDTWTLVSEHDAHVYVCGSIKMGHDVAEAFRQIFCAEGNMDIDAAKDYAAALFASGRYVQELWA